MNKKALFYLTSTGEPVKFGDVIKSSFNHNDIVSSTVITLSEANAPLLLMTGIISETIPVNDSIDITAVINRIASRLGWKPQRVEAFLNGVDEMMPMAAFSVAAREIAIMLDEKYPDHINKSEKIFVISTLDGRVHEVCKRHIKNFRNFAAFRTIEDAKLCCSILRKPLKEMFSGK